MGETLTIERFQDIRALLERWLERAQIVAGAHYRASQKLQKMHYFLGIPSIVLSASVGTTIFATLQETSNFSIKIMVGGASIASAVLAALQTFMRFQDRATKHREAGLQYGSMMRELEAFLAHRVSPEEEYDFLEELRPRWDQINATSPEIPEEFSVSYSLYYSEGAFNRLPRR